MPCRATQNRWVMVESSDKKWSTGEGNNKTPQYSILEYPTNSMKRQKDRTLKDELPRSVGAWEKQKNSSRRNEEAEPKRKQHPVVDASGGESKVRCCKEQYCKTKQNKQRTILHRNLECQVHESNWKWSNRRWQEWTLTLGNQLTKTDLNEWVNSDDHYIYYNGQKSLRSNGIALIVNKRVWNSVLQCNLKSDWMICLQDKPFKIPVIQVYVPTTDAEEAEVNWFYEDLSDILELTPKKDVLFIIGDWNAKVRSQEIPGVTGKFGLGVQNEAGQRLTEFCQENALVIANTLFQWYKRWLYTWTSLDDQYRN